MAILQQYADILLRGRTSAGYTYLSGLARFDIAAGTSSLAPLRVATGVLVSSTVSGAIENDGANLYWTDSNGVRSPLLNGSNYAQYGLSVLQAGRLATGRYIGIGGGVVAEASLFSGEGDLVLQVSSVHADYLTGMVPIDVLPVGSGSGQVAAGDHTHLYAGSASVGGPAASALVCTGNAVTATTLATGRALKIGEKSNNFDGSSDLEWTLADIGASAAGHTHPYIPLSGGTLTGKLTLGTGGSIYKADWDSNVIPYFVSGEMVVNPDVTISSFAPMSHASSDTSYGVCSAINYGHVQASSTLPVANSGVGSVGIETSSFARGDHYHPVVCSVLQAGRLATGRYIGIGGGVVAEALSFSGEGDLVLQVSSVHADYLTGMVSIDVLPVGSGSGQVAAGDHTHTGYLSISGGTVSGALTVNGLVTTGSGIQVNANNTDHYLTFNYLGSSGGEAEGTYSWRIGYLGTGSGDANYLVIESSQTSGTWTRAVQYGLITLDATHYGSILPASGVTKNLGSSTQRWNYLYANNVSATTFTGNGAEITDLSASNLTGQVPVSNGGTGRDTLTQNALLLGNATSAIGMLSIGGANTFLKSTGSGYEWVGIRKNDSSEISSLSTSKESPTAITYVSGDNKVYHLQCTAPTNDQVFYVNLPDLNNVVSGDKLEFTLTRTSGVYDAQVVFNPNTATAIFRLGRSTVAGTSERIRIGTGEAIVFYALYSGQAGLSWRVMRYVDMEV